MSNVITTYKKLPLEVKKAIRDDFPFGLEFELKPIKNLITGGYFEGLIYQYEDILYLIKMNFNTKTIESEEEDDSFPPNEDTFNEEY